MNATTGADGAPEKAKGVPCFCTTGSVSWRACWRWRSGQSPSPSTKRHGDGYGPDPLGVLLYLSLWPVGLLLAHSGLLACLVRARQPASILQGRQGIAIHLALGAGFLAYALYKFHPG